MKLITKIVIIVLLILTVGSYYLAKNHVKNVYDRLVELKTVEIKLKLDYQRLEKRKRMIVIFGVVDRTNLKRNNWADYDKKREEIKIKIKSVQLETEELTTGWVYRYFYSE